MLPRSLPCGALFILLFAVCAPAQDAQKLDPRNHQLTATYLDADRIGKYGYLELAYPKAFENDGLGLLKTKPLIQDHSQTVEDDLRAWIATIAPDLDRSPRSLPILGEIVMVLGGKRLCTLLVPFMDRYLAAGGKPRYDPIMTYVGGLVRLGRYTDALQHYTEAEKKWGPLMASNIACQLFGDRFRTAWLVDRNFQDMLDAQREAMRLGVFPGDRNFMQETICELLRRAARRGELSWFTAHLEKSWIWINEVRLKEILETYRNAGVDPPPALAVAADPLCQGTNVPAPALRYRAVDSLNRGDTGVALQTRKNLLFWFFRVWCGVKG